MHMTKINEWKINEAGQVVARCNGRKSWQLINRQSIGSYVREGVNLPTELVAAVQKGA